MLKRNLPIIRGLHLVIDLGLTLISFHLALLLRQALVKTALSDPLNVYQPYGLLFFILPIWAFFLFLRRECCEYRGKPFHEILKNTGVVILKSFALLLAVLFFTRALNQSRALVLIFLGVNFGLLLSLRGFVSHLLGFFRKRGYNFKNVLIIGTGALARDFIREVKGNPEWGFRIFGLLDWDDRLKGKYVEGLRVTGALEDLPAILKNDHVDYAVFAVCRRFLNRIERSLLTCEEMGVPACLLADFFPLRFSRKTAGEFQKKPAIVFSTAPDSGTSLLLKHISDRLFTLIGIVLLSPLMLVLSFLVKLTSKGPVLFKQKRCGLNGRKFTMLKFRTMVENADQMKDLLADKNEMDGPAFKITDDPRMTKVGHVLRKLSLDELPQLFNVLRGEMSLVGPRPPLPKEVSQYDPWQRRRLSMKPGLTCLWQINGRNNIDFERWMKMDLEYIDNWSLWLDTKILFKTIPAVMLAKGAK
ncbi:MAG: sugar transferase [Candidatus Zixiibacteriota bacterium]|nr:MAG: sugar transferase [candidate division Zixibacteria bacterium]